LAANGLKPLADGLILSSQAQLAASLEASWTRDQLEAARRLVGVLEARARARRMSLLSWPPESEPDARAALAQMPTSSARPQPYGAIVNHADVFDTVACLAQRGVGPVAVAAAAYVFEPSSKAIDSLALRLGQLN
jgi:ATP phosphoribosyltransferase